MNVVDPLDALHLDEQENFISSALDCLNTILEPFGDQAEKQKDLQESNGVDIRINGSSNGEESPPLPLHLPPPEPAPIVKSDSIISLAEIASFISKL